MAGWVLLQGAHRCRARKCYKVEHLCSLCWVEMLFASSLAGLVGFGGLLFEDILGESTSVGAGHQLGHGQKRMFQSCRMGEGSSQSLGWVSETDLQIPWVRDDPDSRDPGKLLLGKIRESDGIGSLFLPQSRCPPLQPERRHCDSI